MKIKSIAALCKKVRHAVIMDSASADGSIVQFIGDGNAAYICDGLPTVEEESLLAIFDVPQEQRNTWHVKRSNVYDKLKAAVEKIKPAHLAVEYVYTYVTHGEIKGKPYTHAQLASYTHDYIRNNLEV